MLDLPSWVRLILDLTWAEQAGNDAGVTYVCTQTKRVFSP